MLMCVLVPCGTSRHYARWTKERKREGGEWVLTGLQDSTVTRGIAELERAGPVPSQASGDWV
jgi:hypothetical protein